MRAPWAVAVGGIFVWLGMVTAISFIEAPLKFRAPGVTLRLGLGIGRRVFRALNAAEVALALTALAALQFDPPPSRVTAVILIAVVVLAVQLLAVRPWLTRRSDAVLAGAQGPRSRAHYIYIALELIKVSALLASGILLFAA